jgi:hypothetical protein
MSSTTSTKSKKYICSHEGCGKGFTRSDHLQRHVLNHGVGDSTCSRCSLHFKRPDLLGEFDGRCDSSTSQRGLITLSLQTDTWLATGKKMKKPEVKALE